MGRIKLIVFVTLLLISGYFLIAAEMIYAEEIQTFMGYNSNFNYQYDYEFKLLEYSFLNDGDKLVFNSFIKNSAYINQNGNHNQSKIFQIGNFGSIVEIIQIGNENNAVVKQFASSAKADVFQFGNNHDLSIEQWGNEAEIYVIQSGNNFENKEIKIIQF